MLASKDESHAEALAGELGPLARATSVEDAVAGADAIVSALRLDMIKELIPHQARPLNDKVVVDPSNPVAFDEKGQGLLPFVLSKRWSRGFDSQPIRLGR